MKKWESYTNLLNNSYDSAIWDLIKNNELLHKKNEILHNKYNDIEKKYNNLLLDHDNIKKSYDELFIKIELLNDKLNNKTPWLLKKASTLKK